VIQSLILSTKGQPFGRPFFLPLIAVFDTAHNQNGSDVFGNLRVGEYQNNMLAFRTSVFGSLFVKNRRIPACYHGIYHA